MQLPDRLPAGTTASDVSAESWNAIVDALDALQGSVGALQSRRDGPQRVRVTAVDAGATAATLGTGEAVASEVRYTVQVLGRPELAPIPNLQPEIGRTVANDEVLIVPAAVGALGWAWQTPNGDGTSRWVLALQEPDTFADDCEATA